ncbi:hypothetical protein [Desertimonas flava]|uniref:hypothetical protein n=1 Tax=Desertimonas flava TaxID=2064846 RepID=UPI000E340B71|nr:hypothetical protein [Desertimonas flava]
MPASPKLPAHTLPADLRSRRIRPYSRYEWRRRLHLIPVGVLRQHHLVVSRAKRRLATAAPGV